MPPPGRIHGQRMIACPASTLLHRDPFGAASKSLHRQVAPNSLVIGRTAASISPYDDRRQHLGGGASQCGGAVTDVQIGLRINTPVRVKVVSNCHSSYCASW